MIPQFSGSYSLFSLAVECGTLTNPANGRVDTPQGTTFEHTATYRCNSGYSLVGNTTRTCQANGLWSGSSPTCGKFKHQLK